MKSTKQVCVGSESFSEFIDGNCYYVDKTRFLRPVFATPGKVRLFTRPRRFGKTLTMNMFHEFLNLDFKNPGDTSSQERLFKGLDVMKDTEFVQKYMGQYPVVFMTLKSVFGETFENAVGKLASVISKTASKFRFLLESPKLSNEEKEKFKLYLNEDELVKPENSFKFTGFLNFISDVLYEHFGRQVVLLIDEYDVPLAKAQLYGYHPRMVTLYAQFLDILKSSGGIGETVKKIVMTGCLKVAKNSIFTGANNFTANTVLSEDLVFSSFMGFTTDETKKFLDEFDLSEYAGLVKENYDGYHFFDQEIFCPWDVCSFISYASPLKEAGRASIIKAKNYWIDTENTGTRAIKGYVGFLSKSDNQNLQDLSDGKEITISVNDELNYDMLSNHNVSDMWSVLLHTGYITAVEQISRKEFSVRIPNKEIKECFDDSIQASFMEALTTDNKNYDILKALSDGDTEKARKLISGLLLSFISNRIYANKSRPENFYEGFMTGLLASFGEKLSDLKVEKEAGSGFADIRFRDVANDSAMVIELKVAKNAKEARLKAAQGIEQIEEKGYAREFIEDLDVPNVSAVGIAFFDKDCVVVSKRLNLN